jgi:hypothetical protein
VEGLGDAVATEGGGIELPAVLHAGRTIDTTNSAAEMAARRRQGRRMAWMVPSIMVDLCVSRDVGPSYRLATRARDSR